MMAQACAHHLLRSTTTLVHRAATVAALALAAACSQDPVAAPDAAGDAAASEAVVAPADLVAVDSAVPADVAAEDIPQKPLTKGIWTQVKVPADPNVSLHGVWTDGTTRAVAVGSNGTVIQNDGLGWAVASQSKFPTLHGVAGGPGGGNTFAVGLGGTIVQAAGSDGVLGPAWGPPGGCAKPADCDDKDACTADSCDAGVCGHEPSGTAGCCGGPHFADAFDKGLGNWVVTETKQVPEGGIVWKAAAMTGKDGGKRATSPPNAAYFGLTEVACDGGIGFCGSFDNGKVVGAKLESPSFKLPKAAKITLSFQLLIDVESGYYDQLQFWVVSAGGAKQLMWDKQQKVPTGTTNGKFAVQTIDLTTFQNQQIKLEISFDSMTKSNNGGEGVFLDDLVVASTCGAPLSGAKSLTKGTLFSVWAAANDDAWAVGEAGFTAHWDGSAWTAAGGGKSRDVYGMGGTAKLGFAVGDQGLAASIGNGGFKLGSVATDKQLRAVAAVDDGKGAIATAVAVGSQGTIAVYKDGAWGVEVAKGLASQELSGVAAFADGSFAATSQNGTIWSRSAAGTWQQASSVGLPLRAIAASGPDSAWAVGMSGGLAERKGGQWLINPQLPGSGNANAVWCQSHDDCMAVGDGGVAWQRAGKVWTQQSTATSVNLQAVWGAQPDSIYAAGLLASIVHYDGQGWSTMTGPPGIDWRAIWGTADNDVWVGGSGGAVAHWDGDKWQLMVEPVTDTLRCVWGLSGSDLWAVGEKGAIYHGNGAGWQKTPIEPYQPDKEQKPYAVKSILLAVWGAASNDVWAAGEPDDKNHGVLVHWDGKVWKYVPLLYELPKTIRAIWGWSADNILMAGTQGTVMAFDGKAGSIGQMEVPTIATLFSIAPYGKDVLVVGDIGTVLRYSPPPKPVTK